MIKRPLNIGFKSKVLDLTKDHTMRAATTTKGGVITHKKPWPIGKDIMLYHWEGKAYHSKQCDIAVIQVISANSVIIKRRKDGGIAYLSGYIKTMPRPLWQHEGFDSQEQMDDWFRKAIPAKQNSIERHLMHFKLIRPASAPTPASAAINRRIQKQADDLGLKITNYEGFARGRWNSDEGYTPPGMWVFTVEASDPSKTTDHEPANIVAENITDALQQMKDWAEYLFR